MIRFANIDDLEEIYRIYSERYDSHDAPSIKYIKSDWEWYLDNDRALIFVMTLKNNIVGVAFSYDMGLWGYLEHIVVAESHRGKGYGRKLLEYTFKYGCSLGWRLFESCYYEEVTQMRSFFEKTGWKDGGISTRWVYREKGKPKRK